MTDGEIAQANSLFQQPWWLDAVAPGAWSAVEVLEGGGRLVARLPFVVRTGRLLVTSGMPPLTQSLGPWMVPEPLKQASGLAREKELMGRLIDGLPHHDHFEQDFHHSVTNWLPFHWRGFAQTTRYTYRLPDLASEDVLWSDLRENIRREVRKARRQLEVRSDLDLGRLVDVLSQTFRRQGLSLPWRSDVIERVEEACAARQRRRMLFAVDARGSVHAAAYLVWDAACCYYLMGGGDPQLRRSGAASLLMWEAIGHARGVSRSFDFEGSMVEPVERFFRAFGARQTPYFRVSRMSRRMRVVVAGRDLWRGLTGKSR